MKDIMFFAGLICWLGWLADTIYFVKKGTSLFTDKFNRIIQFLAITLVILSWYIM